MIPAIMSQCDEYTGWRRWNRLVAPILAEGDGRPHNRIFGKDSPSGPSDVSKWASHTANTANSTPIPVAVPDIWSTEDG